MRSNILTTAINKIKNSVIKKIAELFSSPKHLFDDILEVITPVDFDSITNNTKGKNTNTMQATVIIISELLNVAQKYDRSLRIEQGQIYIYNGKHWEMLNDEKAKDFLGKVSIKIGYDPFRSKYFAHKERLLKQFKSTGYAEEPEHDLNYTYVNFQNTTLVINNNTGEYEKREHKSEDHLRYCLPYSFDSEASSPLFSNFLNEVLDDIETQRLLLEYIGYTFTRGFSLEKILILLGSGSNGKSVIADIIKELLGADNVVSFSLEDVTKDNKYCRSELQNKLLNHGTEISDSLDAAGFKQMASLEPISARAIRKDPIIMKNYAKQVYNANTLPTKGVESSSAFIRRLLIAVFNIVIPEEKQDINLAKKICEKELPGIFNLVLKGLTTILANKSFSPCKASEEIIKEYYEENNPVRNFLEDNFYVSHPQNTCRLSSLYVEFKNYCKENHLTCSSNIAFSRELQDLEFKTKKEDIGRVFYIDKKPEKSSFPSLTTTSIYDETIEGMTRI